MKKTIIFVIIVMQVLLLTMNVSADDTQPSDYELYYPQFVDNKNLDELASKDLDLWNNGYSLYPSLAEKPDKNRTDYFGISYGQDALQKLDIHHLKGNQLRPVIFFIHGGGWVDGDRSQSRYFAPSWISLGYTVVSIDTRLAPANQFRDQIDDCAKALKWVMENISKYGGDPNRIAITGHSSGAHLAALLVTGTEWQKRYNINMSKVKCWFPLSGIYDFNLKENYYHSAMAFYCNSFLSANDDKSQASPINHVTGKEPPSLIIHGGDDWLVPKTNAISFYNKLKEKGTKTQLEIVKGYRHTNMMITYGESGHVPTQLVSKFLAKYLPTCQNNIGDYKEEVIDDFKDDLKDKIKDIIDKLKEKLTHN